MVGFFSRDGEPKMGFSTSAIGNILVQQSLPSGMTFCQALVRNYFSSSRKTNQHNQKPKPATSHAPKNNQSSLLLGSRGVQSPYHSQASQHLACPSVPLNCVLKERTVEQRWNWALPCSMLVMAGGYSSPLGGIVAHVLPLSF